MGQDGRVGRTFHSPHVQHADGASMTSSDPGAPPLGTPTWRCCVCCSRACGETAIGHSQGQRRFKVDAQMLTGGLSVVRTGLRLTGPCTGPQGRPEPLEHQGPTEDASPESSSWRGPPLPALKGTGLRLSVHPSIHPVPQTLPQWPRPRGATEAVFVFSVTFVCSFHRSAGFLLFTFLSVSAVFLKCVLIES